MINWVICVHLWVWIDRGDSKDGFTDNGCEGTHHISRKEPSSGSDKSPPAWP